jgi:hypothetical protein
VDASGETQVRRTVAKHLPGSSKPQREPAGSGLHALRSAMSKPLSRKSVAVAESPTDAQFLESFEEM